MIVVAHGITYPSVKDCAAAYGLTPGAVYQHLDVNGHLDGLGAGRGRRGKPITIRGVTYSTVAEASEALGVVRSVIYEARRVGRLDMVGLGRTG